jgi:hypothetical protein
MFRVQWLAEAVEELARIWTDADSTLRQAVTAATQALDEELRLNPFRQSESREDERRVLFLYPLAARIKVDLEQRIVWVLHVWQFRRRGK